MALRREFFVRPRCGALVILIPTGILLAATSAAPTRPTGRSPASKPVLSQTMTFPSEDGVLIVADYFAPARKAPDKAPLAILIHGEGTTRAAWRPLMSPLHAAGFAVLALDLRGHGESIEPKALRLRERAAVHDARLYRTMTRDVAAAYRWLTRQPGVDPARFALLGAGVGGAVALDYAARDRSVDAIAWIGPVRDIVGLAPAASVDRCRTRLILLIASEDRSEAANELHAALAKATLRLVPSAAAATAPAQSRDAELLARNPDLPGFVTSFLQKAVGPATQHPVVATIDGEVYYAAGTGRAVRIKEENRRWFSGAEEAQARGLRPPKVRGTRGDANDTNPKAIPASPRAAPPAMRNPPSPKPRVREQRQW